MTTGESDVLDVLRKIERGEIALMPNCDPQEQVKGGVSYRTSNDWIIDVSNWSGEFAGIVEITTAEGQVYDINYLEQHMPQVEAYFPNKDVAWRAYGMKMIETGFLYLPSEKLGRFKNVKAGDIVTNPGAEAPWIIVYPNLNDVLVARWPGRLWLVHMRERLEPQDHRGKHICCISVKIIRNMSTHLLFGPHGEAVEQVLGFAARIDRTTAKSLAFNRHKDAAEISSQGWHRWQEVVTGKSKDPNRDMSGVVWAANNLQSPVGYGLSRAHRAVCNAAERQEGDAAFDEDEEERWLISPWSGAGSAMLETVWALGAPELFDETERDILLQAWRARERG